MEIKNMVQEGECVATYVHSSSYFGYQCIIRNNSDDICAALEDTLHRIIDAGGTPKDISRIMGAIVPDDELIKDLEEYGEYVPIDLGYVIPGLIVAFAKDYRRTIIYHLV